MIALYTIINYFERLGKFVFFNFEIISETFRRPFRLALIFQHLQFIGNQSTNIILLTGFFTGAVFGLQIGSVFQFLKAAPLMGGSTGIALSTELAPLITGFLLAGRVGSAITAEISTMKVNEQIEALEAMGINPIHYLVVPRVLASAIIMPFLCGLFMFSGIIGCYFIGLFIYDIDEAIFIDKLQYLVSPHNIITGLRKMFVFSTVISVIACYTGIHSSGGAKGVGIATTNAVIRTLLYILILDFIISYTEVVWLK